MSRAPSEKKTALSDKAWLMREASKITKALGQTFAPICEVVLHDLTDPEHAIAQIENNLSGRAVGDSTTELGLARIADPNFPDVVANYANQFADGRAVKCTSIGLRDKNGSYVAAICLNIDISYLVSVSTYLTELSRVSKGPLVNEHLTRRPTDVSAKVLAFSASKNRDPRALTSDERSELLQRLAEEGDLERRGAADTIAAIIGVSRSNIYYYLKKGRKQPAPEQTPAAERAPSTGRRNKRTAA